MLNWLHICHFNSRLTYSDLCLRIPDSKFRQCLLRTLAVLFDLMCSYHEIMDFQLERKVISGPPLLCAFKYSCGLIHLKKSLWTTIRSIIAFNFLLFSLHWLEKSFFVFHSIS